jgi:opacity protein-like surface antigen
MRNLFVLGALALAGTAGAQSINFGVTAGADLDIAKLENKTTNVTSYYKSEVGGFAGLFLEYRENKHFRVQAGANYMFDNDVFKKDSKGAIQLPLTLKFYVFPDKFNVQIGSRIRYTLDEYAIDYNRVHFGLTGGLGYELSKCFFVDANYIYQLNNGVNQDYDNTLSEKINYLQVGFGYRF